MVKSNDEVIHRKFGSKVHEYNMNELTNDKYL